MHRTPPTPLKSLTISKPLQLDVLKQNTENILTENLTKKTNPATNN